VRKISQDQLWHAANSEYAGVFLNLQGAYTIISVMRNLKNIEVAGLNTSTCISTWKSH